MKLKEIKEFEMVSDGINLFKVEKKDSVGRYAVAIETLPAGSIVFEELPFAIGPQANTRAVCLECCAPTDGTKNGPRCNKCGWPMCDDCKLNSTRKFHEKECEIFQQNRVKFYDLVTPHQNCLQLECIMALR